MRVVYKFGVPLVLASAGLLAFIGRWEDGNKAKADYVEVYADRLAGGLPTACRGITKWTSPVPVIVGDIWSREQCDEVERMVVEKSQLKLLDCFKVRINQSQLDAFTSFAHNVGVPAACASKAMGLTNAGRASDGCWRLSTTPAGQPNWSFVTRPDGSKMFVQGLYNRRRAETATCLKGFG